MKRGIEVMLILMISVLTVSATATYIQSVNQGSPDTLDVLISRGFQTVTTWLRTQSAKDEPNQHAIPALGSERTQNQRVAEPTPDRSVPNDQPQHVVGTTSVRWSNSDLHRLRNIVSTLFISVKPAEWSGVFQSLSTADSNASANRLLKVIHHHLTQSDFDFLANKFSGNAAFGLEDVSLLHQVLDELHRTLSPEKERMLVSILENSLGNIHGSTTD